jgi:hypothetical protein
MKYYLLYAPLALVALWVYVLVENLRNRKQLKRAAGSSYLPLLYLTSPLNRKDLSLLSPAFRELVQKHRKQSRRLLRVWLISLLVFLLITICVGIATA